MRFDAGKIYTNMNDRLFWIDLGYATFGIISIDNVIVDSAPIAKWMRGKTLQEINPWLLDKKAKVIEV